MFFSVGNLLLRFLFSKNLSSANDRARIRYSMGRYFQYLSRLCIFNYVYIHIYIYSVRVIDFFSQRNILRKIILDPRNSRIAHYNIIRY